MFIRTFCTENKDMKIAVRCNYETAPGPYIDCLPVIR